MVEVMSPRPRDERRDRIEKTSEYALFGVKYYWIINPAVLSLEIFELGSDGRYVLALVAGEGKVERVPGCEGLMIDLDDLWTDVEAAETDGDTPPSGEEE
jgi:Uma2 family endonuclease